MKNVFTGFNVKKVLGVVSVIVAGCAAVANTISEQRKNAEFEEMKQTLSELKNK